MPLNVLAKVTSKNQITLPKAVRERLNVRKGSIIRFYEGKSGEIVISVVKEVESPSKVIDRCLSYLDVDAVDLQHMIPKLIVTKVLKELKHEVR
jgi:AbrB family looped-hinge helix DNA binding protein